MAHYSSRGIPFLTTNLSFYFLGLASAMIYPLFNVVSYLFLRFVGLSVYDADCASFVLRRFTLAFGGFTCIFCIGYGRAIDCEPWCWSLFLTYFITAFYVYSLSHNLVFISKAGFFCAVSLCITSHGVLMSSIYLMFSPDHNYQQDNPSLRFTVFALGSFSSGLVVKILIKFNGGDLFTDTGNYETLKFFNRLFISFTVLSLVPCFFLTAFHCPKYPSDIDPPSITETKFMKSFWVFAMAIFSWYFSPIVNNLTMSVIHTLHRTEMFEVEYYQFISAFGMTLIFYFTDYFDFNSFRKRAYSYNSLYSRVCTMLRYRDNTPLSPNIKQHQDVKENVEKLSNQLSKRIFCQMPTWNYLPYGFWTEWEEYDNFYYMRLFQILQIHLEITAILDEDPFNYELYYYLGCTEQITPQEHYRRIIEWKYALISMICSHINFCNVTACKIDTYFNDSATNNNGNGGKDCILKDLSCKQCCCCASCSQYKCENGCCSVKDNSSNAKKYVESALKASTEDCNALLYDIHTAPQLADNLKVNYDQMIYGLRTLEEMLMRFVVFTLYARMAYEYLTLSKWMPRVAKKFTEDYNKYKLSCSCEQKQNCEDEENRKTCSCTCILYCNFMSHFSTLHKHQKESCDIMIGNSVENLIDKMPPLSLTRSILLLASVFHDIMMSELMCEKGDCHCIDHHNKAGCLCSMKCVCTGYNTRIADIIGLITKAFFYLSDSDPILSQVISVVSTFLSFKYPTSFHENICYMEGIGFGNEVKKTENESVLSVFSGIYSEFSSLMETLLPRGHVRNGLECNECVIKADLCICVRQLITNLREVCSLIQKVSREIGTTNVSVCYVNNYDTIELYCQKLCCAAKKLEDCCKCDGSNGCKCFNGSSDSNNGAGKFIKELCGALKSTVDLIKTLNNSTKDCIEKVSESLKDQLPDLNKKNENLYRSQRGLRMGLIIQPSKLHSKLITYYKNPIIAEVPDYRKGEFLLFMFLGFTILAMIYLSRLLPYLRNVPNIKKFKIMFVIYSLITTYYFHSSFGYLATLGTDSIYKVSIAVITGIFLGVFMSILTEWFTYRMYLYEQFVRLYKRFRIILPGSQYFTMPKFFWWFEGFLTFVKLDILSMCHLITLERKPDTYNPLNFGFTEKLDVDYDLAEEGDHIFSEEDCFNHIKQSVLECKKVQLESLLDYRSFYYIFKSDISFLKKPCINLVDYSIDLLYQAWAIGTPVGEISNRLHHLKEKAIIAMEKRVQLEAQQNDYDYESVFKLKKFFQFKHESLLKAPREAVLESCDKDEIFLTLQSRRMVKLYEKTYIDKWEIYYEKYREATERRDSQSIFQDMTMEELLKRFSDWRAKRFEICNKKFDDNDLCKFVVTKACEDFSKFAYGKDIDVKSIMNNFMSLVSSSYTIKDLPKEIDIIKHLSKPIPETEHRDVKPILEKITKMLKKSYKERADIIMDFEGLVENMAYEMEMEEDIINHGKYVIGEWIRWQGLHTSGELVDLLLQFLVY